MEGDSTDRPRRKLLKGKRRKQPQQSEELQPQKLKSLAPQLQQQKSHQLEQHRKHRKETNQQQDRQQSNQNEKRQKRKEQDRQQQKKQKEKHLKRKQQLELQEKQQTEKPQVRAEQQRGPGQESTQPTKRPRLLNDADEGRTVFVRNVSFGSSTEAVQAYFESSVGPVAECRIVRDPLTEHSRGQAFVKFRSKSDADACLLRAAADGGSGFRLDGSDLRLCLAVTRERLAQLDKTPPAGVAAGADLRKRPSAGKRNLHLARAGQLRRGSSEAEGVPESELALREQLERRAREALRNPDVLVSPTRLCVHGLPRGLSDRELRGAFVSLGGPGCRVTECRIMRDTARLDGGDAKVAPGAKVAGRSRGFAFVAFGDHEHAMRAVEAARTGPALPDGRRLIVQFSLERQSALRKKRKTVDTPGSGSGGVSDSTVATAGAAALVSRVPKPAGVRGGIPAAPKRRARDRGVAASGAARKREQLREQRRQAAGRLSRKEFRRKRKEALIREGRLK